MVKRHEASKEQGMEKAKERRAGSGRSLMPFEDMDRFFESVFDRPWRRGWPLHMPWEWPLWAEARGAFERTPKVDVIDRPNEVVVQAELPGVSKDDLEITLSDSDVTIRASTRREEKEEKENYYRCEISRGEFVRTVALPAEVDGDNVKASFKNGVLELTLPKVESSKRRKITVE